MGRREREMEKENGKKLKRGSKIEKDFEILISRGNESDGSRGDPKANDEK